MSGKQSLSATNLAVHQHLGCDLYIHNVYHGAPTVPSTAPDSGAASPSELAKAQYQRGLDWETSLYGWLDQSQLLLKVPRIPLEADNLLENIQVDDRDHFFITGLTFWPPQSKLDELFLKFGTERLKFGLAKPDLLEINRTEQGVQWRVIDAKASRFVKTSHHIQIYFYTLCLNYLFSSPSYRPADSAGIWLPPKDGFHSTSPSTEDIKAVSVSLLAPALDTFIFRDLSRVIALPRDRVKWHYNPLCQGCKYEPGCRSQAQEQGKIGSMPNLSIDDARVLKDLLHISHVSSFSIPKPDKKLTDIEELHELIASPNRLESLSRYSATTVKRAKRILALPKKYDPKQTVVLSPVVEASRTNTVQVIPRRNYTCPSREDIVVIISVIHDPASPNPGGEFFCISSYSDQLNSIPSLIQGVGKDFIPTLAKLIRDLRSLSDGGDPVTTQFYAWSSGEYTLLQTHIINAALTSSADDDDIRLCVGALAQGASLLQTTFQPLLLSGALLSFLGKGRRTKAEYVACLGRMGLSTEGTVEVLRKRVEGEIRQMQDEASKPGGRERHKEYGQLPRVVVLKREVERQLALPTPGYWDLPECASVLVGAHMTCPSDEQIFTTYKKAEDSKSLEGLLALRNRCIFLVLRSLRKRALTASGQTFFVNEAKVLSTKFMDICREPHLRKLFFMQQFEVLAKLTELWQSRIDGCPDAAILEYRATVQGPKGPEHVFRLVSGNVDTPSSEKDHGFYDYLISLDTSNASATQDHCDKIPAEALFDDLGVSGLVFPLNRYTKVSWETQDARVRQELCVADLRNVFPDREGRETNVAVRLWGNWNARLEEGSTYRLSPRLIDFNTTKVLSTLFETDLRWASDSSDFYEDDNEIGHCYLPFLQLILAPNSLGEVSMAKEYVKTENDIQKLFRDLRGLGNQTAGSLALKASQHRATQRILSNRLSVIWGPPGTGKTYTISLSLLRLLEVQRRHDDLGPKVIFITAITHAAIEACRSKLVRLIEAYRSIDNLPTDWLNDLKIEVVTKGNDHPAPPKGGSTINVYAGTIYQLWNFTKRHSLEVDCVIIDEAGQISLGSVSLVLRSLSHDGRIIIAGDSEQLAPILSAQYPLLKSHALFGSVLDCLMFTRSNVKAQGQDRPPSPSPGEAGEIGQSQSTVVQLTENFRLNPDLGEFVSTIYSRQFKPQKVQARQTAIALRSLHDNPLRDPSISPPILESTQTFLVALSDVMYRQPQTVLAAPEINSENLFLDTSDVSVTHRPVSLALLRLQTRSSRTDDISYETHVRGEAAVAAALVASLRKCLPNEDIFVATPHRIQREAVKLALAKLKNTNRLEDIFHELCVDEDVNKPTKPRITVDTIERLQGSEAAFVICLFSLPKSFASDLGFLLERRRLNVAISRAKTLCLLISSDEVLCPSVKALANEETAKGYAFLKAFEKRAWSYNLSLNVDQILKA